MIRSLLLGAAVVTGWLGWVSVSQAQVYVQVPFVRVYVGDGVAVRAPFVDLYVPRHGGPVLRPTYHPQVIVPSPTGIIQSPPPAPVPQPSPPVIVDPSAPPQPVQPAQVPTIEAFAKTFQAKAGAYEVTLLNPITKQPTVVHFTLPEGTPRRVNVTRNHVKFVYSLRQWVLIDFNRNGVTVTSR
jgi:hypothetical protein